MDKKVPPHDCKQASVQPSVSHYLDFKPSSQILARTTHSSCEAGLRVAGGVTDEQAVRIVRDEACEHDDENSDLRGFAQCASSSLAAPRRACNFSARQRPTKKCILKTIGYVPCYHSASRLSSPKICIKNRDEFIHPKKLSTTYHPVWTSSKSSNTNTCTS